MKLTIKATSGGVRGDKDSGEKFSYEISKDTFLALAEQVFESEVKAMKPENTKSGGMVSQMLHAYGASADRLATYLEASGEPVFPESGGEFTPEHIGKWLECMDYRKARTVDYAAKQAKWDANAAAMKAAGLDEAFINQALGKRPVVKEVKEDTK